MYNKNILGQVDKCRQLIKIYSLNKKHYYLEFTIVDMEEYNPLMVSRAVQVVDFIVVQLWDILNL